MVKRDRAVQRARIGAAPARRRRPQRAGRPSRARAAGLATAAVALALAACDADFTPQYLVRDLRILSIRADVQGSGEPSSSDADVGDVVRLSALVADPAARPDLRVEWFVCLPRPGETVPPCLDPSAIRDLDRLAATPGVLRLGEGSSLEVAVPPELRPELERLAARAAERPELRCTLYAELPVRAVARAGGEVRTAVKAARVAPRPLGEPVYVRNLNPRIGEVRAAPADVARCGGGQSIARRCATDADCGGGVACQLVAAGPGGAAGVCDEPLERRPQPLCATAASGSSQTFAQCDPSGALFPEAEELRWQWYATAGEFDTGEGRVGIGNATGDDLTFTPPAGPFTLWVILRDGRGGEDWVRRDFR